MLALYRSGRQAEALEVYRDARRVLVEQVGVEPGPELQRLQQAVLDHDASLELPPAGGEELAPTRGRGGAPARGGAEGPAGCVAGAARCRGLRTGRSGARARSARSRSGCGPSRCGC